ncbi:hypothetical protein GGG16DRAFT_35956, partial [Schizophyllum commune]
EKCAWYREGLVAQWTAPRDPLDDLVEDVSGIDLDDRRDLFQLVPPSDFATTSTLPAMGEAGPGPSTLAHRQAQLRTLDDFEDTRTIDEYIGAGARIRMDREVHERWRQRFHCGKQGGTEGDGEDGKEPIDRSADDLYQPFASELDWRIAHWVL